MIIVWDKIKSAARWVWNWVTVLTAILMGVFTVAVDYFDQIAGIDLTQVMTQRRAAQITFGVAIAKGIVAAYNARKAKA